MINRTTQYDYLNYDGLEYYHRELQKQLNEKFDQINLTINNLEQNKSCKCEIYFGSTNNRPTQDLFVGLKYFDTDLNIPIYWDGNKWIDSDGNSLDLPHKGSTEERPENVKFGYIYYNTDIENIQIFNGTDWNTLCECNNNDDEPLYWYHIETIRDNYKTSIESFNWIHLDNNTITEINTYNWIKI